MENNMNDAETSLLIKLDFSLETRPIDNGVTSDLVFKGRIQKIGDGWFDVDARVINENLDDEDHRWTYTITILDEAGNKVYSIKPHGYKCEPAIWKSWRKSSHLECMQDIRDKIIFDFIYGYHPALTCYGFVPIDFKFAFDDPRAEQAIIGDHKFLR